MSPFLVCSIASPLDRFTLRLLVVAELPNEENRSAKLKLPRSKNDGGTSGGSTQVRCCSLLFWVLEVLRRLQASFPNCGVRLSTVGLHPSDGIRTCIGVFVGFGKNPRQSRWFEILCFVCVVRDPCGIVQELCAGTACNRKLPGNFTAENGVASVENTEFSV